MSGGVGYALAAAFVVAAVLFLVRVLDVDGRRMREFEAALAARAPLTDGDMAARFAPDDPAAVVAARVRRIFADHTGYPAEKLHPDDDLMFFWAELDAVDLIRDLEAAFGVVFTDDETERTPCTIRSVSALAVRKGGREPAGA